MCTRIELAPSCTVKQLFANACAPAAPRPGQAGRQAADAPVGEGHAVVVHGARHGEARGARSLRLAHAGVAEKLEHHVVKAVSHPRPS